MRFTVSLFAVLATTTSIAAAESYDGSESAPAQPSRGYVDVGPELGLERTLILGAKLDGGLRLGNSPLFARAQLTAGYSGDEGGRYQQARVGLEARGCVWRELVCGFAGSDAGYQHDHMISTDSDWEHSWTNDVDAHDLMVVPRVGLELGAPIRFRTAIEVPMYRAVAISGPDMDTNADESRGTGLVLSMSMGYAF